MKVLFVQNIEGIAGSEKYFWQLLPALKEKGLNVEFLCVHKKKYTSICQEFAQELIKKNSVVHFIETSSYIHPSVIFKMKKLIRNENYDIIHSHLIYADFWSAVLKRFFKIKPITISTLHGYQEDIYTKFCLEPKNIPKNKYYKIARFTYKKLDFIYACSHGLKNFFEQIEIKTKIPISVIHHGFDYAPLPIKAPDANFTCVIVGRLIPRKGHDLVLKKCQWLKEQIPNFKLIIVGGGDLENQIRQKISDKKLNDFVQLTGYSDTPRLEMSKADVVLVPSYAEGLPLVIFEAMSLAKPVVAFDTIGPAEVVIDNQTGFLIKPFDENLFAEKIVQLHSDSELRTQMGIAAKKSVEAKFSLATMTDETIRYYQMCLNSRPFLTT